MARKVYCPATASIYIEASDGAKKLGKIGVMYEMPNGHCMFDRPWEYGRIACNDKGIPGFLDADQKRNTRRFISDAMRHYAEIARGDHTWSDIYPAPSDARAAAISMARYMSDHGMRF